MPERSQKRKLRRDQPEHHELAEESSLQTDQNNCISEQDFENISSKVENKVSERLRDTEHNQREILKLIENLTAKVDSLSNSTSSEPNYLNSRTKIDGNLQGISVFEHIDIPGQSNEYSNRYRYYFRKNGVFSPFFQEMAKRVTLRNVTTSKKGRNRCPTSRSTASIPLIAVAIRYEALSIQELYKIRQIPPFLRSKHQGVFLNFGWR